MAGLFDIPQRAGRNSDALIAKKSNSVAKKTPTAVKGGGGLAERINTIRAVVNKNLGYLESEYIIIQDESVLKDYITTCVDNGIISIDTETTGLDPISDELVGICIYTPNQKAAYIPVNHRSYITNQLVSNQLPVGKLKEQFQRVADAEIDVIMFNAPFDVRFLRNHIGVLLKCTWDCSLGSRLLNENEGAGNRGLKKLHQKYVLNGEGDAFKFDDLFKGITFDLIPIKVGYLYAAHDAIITYELYEFQKPFLTADDEVCIEHVLQDVAWVFHNIEMPCVAVVVDMEDTGVDFDLEFANVLHEKYTESMEKILNEVYDIIHLYDNEIAEYKAKNPNHKLSDPINISSPTQIAILLYDIIGQKSVDANSPRGTGEDILKKMDIPLGNKLLEYRGVKKLIDTYIDKLPDCVNSKDHRIHCKFNQYGADTGRFSSSNPNLQNIPSHNKEIRKMFKASEGYVYADVVNDMITVSKWCEVETISGFKYAHDVVVGETLLFDDESIGVVTKVEQSADRSTLSFQVIVKEVVE